MSTLDGFLLIAARYTNKRIAPYQYLGLLKQRNNDFSHCLLSVNQLSFSIFLSYVSTYGARDYDDYVRRESSTVYNKPSSEYTHFRTATNLDIVLFVFVVLFVIFGFLSVLLTHDNDYDNLAFLRQIWRPN